MPPQPLTAQPTLPTPAQPTKRLRVLGKLLLIGSLGLSVLALNFNNSLAADGPLGFAAAISQALTSGPDLATSRANLKNAQADLVAKQSDPSTLIVPLTQSQHATNLAQVNFNAQKFTVMSNVITAASNLYEGQQNIALLTAQAALDNQNLEVAKAKLTARNGTALDVSKAQNTLASSQQSLSDSKANLPILSNRLEALLGVQTNGNLQVAAPPNIKENKIDVASLEKNLDTRLTSVVQSSQSVDLAEINVKLADNDYTPPATLRDAKTSLENAQRNLATSRSNAVTSLRDAARNSANSLERLNIAKKNLENSAESLAQDQAKWKSGTISRVQLQSSQLAVQQSQYSLLQASNSYLRSLATLSTAAGQDQTGLLEDGP
jgi:outer membrane protein